MRGVAISEITPARRAHARRRRRRRPRLLTAADRPRPASQRTVLEAALAAGRRRGRGVVSSCSACCRRRRSPTAPRWMALPAAMITASHNPFADNGVKLFAAGRPQARRRRPSSGRGDAATAADRVARRERRRPDRIAVDGAVDGYVEHVVDTFGTGSLGGMRIVLDCANGGMSTAAPAVLRAARRRRRPSSTPTPDGRNINADCGATRPPRSPPRSCAAGPSSASPSTATATGSSLSTTRAPSSTATGLIALSALDLRARGELHRDTVVVTVMTNLGFHRAMAAAGIAVVTTPVGDRNVLPRCEQGGFSLGGEQSGHLIYPALATTGDGLLAGLVVAELVRRSRASARRARRRGDGHLPPGLWSTSTPDGCRAGSAVTDCSPPRSPPPRPSSATTAACSCAPAAPRRWFG